MDNQTNQDQRGGGPPLPRPDGYARGSPLDDEYYEIGNGWAVIFTQDGWEMECQHSGMTLSLEANNREAAIVEAKVHREIMAAENTSSNTEDLERRLYSQNDKLSNTSPKKHDE